MLKAVHKKIKQVLNMALILSCVFVLLGSLYWIYSATVLADKKEDISTQVVEIFPAGAAHSWQWENTEALLSLSLEEDAEFQEFNSENSVYIELSDAGQTIHATQIDGSATTDQASVEDEEQETPTSSDVAPEESPASTSESPTSASESETGEAGGDREPGSPVNAGDDSEDEDQETSTSSSSLPESTEELQEDEEKEMPFCLSENGDCLYEQIEITEFDTDGLLDGEGQIDAQLRLSLSANPVNSDLGSASGTDLGDKVVIEYLYKDEWITADELHITENISNFTNGGYFLHAMPAFNNTSELKDFGVRITYMSRNSVPASEIYIDSIWIEAEILSSLVEEIPNPLKDADLFDTASSEEGIVLGEETSVDEEESAGAPPIQPPGLLKKPVLHEIISPDVSAISFGVNNNPQFSLRHKSQNNNSSTSTSAVANEGQQFEIKDIEIVSIKGRRVNAEVEINYTDKDAWDMQIIPQGDITPGKHTVRFNTVEEDGNVREDEFQFYWGVLAVNTNKASFFPRETVYIQAAVLDDAGDTICDADINIEVTDPSGNRDNIPIILSGECDGNNYTEVPDYFAYYETDQVGEYTMRLTRLDEEGDEFYAIEDSFYVEDTPLFEIERVGPTRINPIFPYKTEIFVKANEDFAGEIIETVPSSFEVKEITDYGLRITDYGDVKHLTWDIELSKGEAVELSYVFDAPNISPALFLAGPLELHASNMSHSSNEPYLIFQENRQWQIASDNPGQFSRPNTDIETGSWTPTPLFEEINDTTRNDATFINSDNHQTTMAEIGMSNVDDPGTDAGHFLRYTYRKDASGGFAIDFRIRLMDGATEVASFTHTSIPASFQEVEQELSAAHVANISDYNNLHITLECLDGGLCSGGQPPQRRGVDVSWVEFEVPFPSANDPPTMETHDPFNVTETGASASGTIVTDGGGTVTERGFVWGKASTSTPGSETPPGESGYENNTFQTGSFATGTYSLSMSNLEPGTTYFYRSYAENSAGYGYGNEVEFKTAIAPPTVETDPADNIGPGSADGHGNITALGGEDQDIVERGFVWATSTQSDPGDVAPTSTTYDFFVNATGTFATGTFSLPITGLDTDTTYLFRAYARNSEGRYSYGQEREFTTTGDLPAVATLSAQNITRTSAAGRGDIQDVGANNPTERGFVWGTVSRSNPGNIAPEDSDYTASTTEIDAGGFGTGVFSLSLTDLEPDTTYFYRAYAFNTEGYSYGSEVQFTTPDELPNVTTNAPSDEKTRSVIGNGDVTDDGGLTITERGFVWDTVSRGEPASTTAPADSDYAFSTTTSGTFGMGVFSIDITQLHFDTQYFYRAYALNSEGYKYGNQMSFTTADAQFSRPNNDATVGGWSPTPLFERINSETIDFGQFIVSDDNTSPDTAVIELEAIGTPADDVDHFLRYVFKKDEDGGHVIDLTVRLLHDGNLIEEWAHANITNDFVYAEQELTEAQAGNITDYSLLTLEFIRGGDTGGGGGTRRSAEVYWAEFETPDPTQFDPPTVTVSSATDIGMFEAQGNGNVTDDGNSTILSRGFAWATTSQALPDSTTDPDSSGYSNWATTTAGTGAYDLIMQPLEADTQYFYRAFAENSEGWGWSSSEESFTTLPITPLVDTNAADAGATSATGTGNITHLGNSTTTERGFVWATTSQADPGNITPENSGYSASTTETDVNGFTTGTYQLTLDNLDPDTQYFYRAYAANSDGYAYGDEVSFTTGSALPELTTFAPPDPIGPETATGTADLSYLGSSDVTERGFVWATSSIETDPGNVAPENSGYTASTTEIDAGGFGTGIYQLEITGLEELTTYFYRAYARNSDGYAYGNEIEFETVSNLAQVATLNPNNVSTSTADGRGDITSTGLGDVTERGFVWDLVPHGEPASTTQPSETPYPNNTNEQNASGFSAGEYDLLLEDLVEGVVYYYRAYVLNDAGYTYGNEMSFATVSTRPTMETHIPSTINENSAMGEGTIVDIGANTVTSRGFVWSTSSQGHPGNVPPTPQDSGYENNISEGVSVDTAPADYNMNLSGLQPGTTYFYRSFAQNDDGYNYGNEIEFETPAAPQVTDAILNGGDEIALIEGTTTSVSVSATATDLNGWEDLDMSTAQAVIYRSGAGDGCSADDNNCYITTNCSLNPTSTTTAELTCTADIWFFAEPTDIGSPHEAEEWLAKIEICDDSNLCDEDTSGGVDLLTLLAISSTQLIDYGTLEPGDDTGTVNQTTTFGNTGNISFNVDVSGTAMIGPDIIAVGNQKYHPDPFDYSATGTPLTDTAVFSGVTLAKPTSTTPTENDLFWGLGIGSGFPGGAYTGENVFTADP